MTTDVEHAVTNAQAVYTETWASTEGESERSQRTIDRSRYQVNAELIARAEPDAVFMHPHSARRGNEVTAEVIDGPQSIAFEQAANRLPTRDDLIQRAAVKEGDRRVENRNRSKVWHRWSRVAGGVGLMPET